MCIRDRDQEGRALPYFRKALEKLPGDEDTQKLIDACESLITLPQFSELSLIHI